MKSSAFINDAEALTLLNELWPELYSELVTVYENYYYAEHTFTIQSGTNRYDLPDDFYKILGVDYKVGEGAYITLKPFMEGNRNQTLTTNVTIPNGTILLRYVPAPQIFTDLDEEIDGIAGWDRLLSLSLAIAMLNAEESDSSAQTAQYTRMLQRIQSEAAPRDAGMPARVVDTSRPNLQWVYGSLAYRMRGNYLDFVNTEFLGADLFPDLI